MEAKLMFDYALSHDVIFRIGKRLVICRTQAKHYNTRVYCRGIAETNIEEFLTIVGMISGILVALAAFVVCVITGSLGTQPILPAAVAGIAILLVYGSINAWLRVNDKRDRILHPEWYS